MHPHAHTAPIRHRVTRGPLRRAVAVTAALTVGAVAYAGVPAGPATARPASTHAVAATSRTAVVYSSGKPRNARLTIPAIGLRRLPVIAYRGKTDDGPGTRIQNRGIAASPYGKDGGTGPGGIGNYQVTAHRSSHGGIFRRVPSLDPGDKVYVDAGMWRYVYRVTRTRWVSFRSARSLRAQRAAVPGHPGRTAHRGFITISTCATYEDHARGNYWTDRYGNPEHRIDKVGVLVKRVHNPFFHRRHR
jgi:sortase A